MKLRTREGREEVTVALLNSGFESETPQILLPINLAKRLNLWDRVIVEGSAQVLELSLAPLGFMSCLHPCMSRYLRMYGDRARIIGRDHLRCGTRSTDQ